MSNDVSTAEATRGIQPGVAGTGGVTSKRFSSYCADDHKISVAESGFASGITVETALVGKRTAQKQYGSALLTVNAQSVNIAVGDPIKPTTGGIGVKAATNKDKYSAIAQGVSTTDGDVISVLIERGVCNI